MKLKNMLIALAICSSVAMDAKAQKLIREDVKTFVQNIQVIPAGIDEFHQAFTVETNYGTKTNDAALSTAYEQLKSWISTIHEATILKKIEDFPQANMSFTIQFDDERLKLLMRPLIGPAMLKNQQLIKGLGQQNVEKLVALEKTFDWMQYYKAYDKIKKDWMQKDAAMGSESFELKESIPMVNTEWGLQKDPVKLRALTNRLAKEKVLAELQLFQQYQEIWNNYFNKYKASVIQLYQLLEEIHYGENLSSAEQKILADIQARSLESIERMVWEEMGLAISSEVFWNDKQIVEQFDKELAEQLAK